MSEKRYRWPDGSVMTQSAYFAAHPPVSKSVYLRTRSRRKVHGENADLAKPVFEYTFWLDEERRCGYDVTKALYDRMGAPERLATPSVDGQPMTVLECKAWAAAYEDTYGGWPMGDASRAYKAADAYVRKMRAQRAAP